MKEAYQVKSGDTWILCKRARVESSGWLTYELHDGSNGLARPENWRAFEPLTQEQLDDIIRTQATPNAVEKILHEGQRQQEYLLSNDSVLIISKRSGQGRIERAGRVIRRF